MLESHQFKMDGVNCHYYTQVRLTEDLPTTLQFWMAHAARDLLRLGVYFRAVAFMCQIPGGANYRWVPYDNNDDGLPGQDDDPWHRVQGADRETVLNVLAECLRRLGALGVMKRIPGGRDHKPKELSDEWKEHLDQHAKVKHGLLNVVAECLDELIVRPGMAEIDAEPRPTWWQQWWARMKEPTS